MQDGVVPFEPGGLEALHTEVLRLTRLIGEIERLAEAEARPRTLETRPVPLDVLAGDIGRSLAGAFEAADVVMHVEAGPSRAMADPDGVRQIVTNLVSNAIRHTPRGGRVTLRTYEEGGRAVLTVSDTGPGIDPAESERVFERFYRGPRAGSADGGVGLGLTIARDLASAQGGFLTHRPTESGAMFVLSLPRPAVGDRSLLSDGELGETAHEVSDHPSA
jgi:two-component system sensor histidine kinase BaeS